MSTELTIEQVMEIGETSKRILLSNLSPEELDAYINPAYKQKVHDEGIKQGIEQGKKTKQIEVIIRLLTHRFGAVPDEVDQALARCTFDQLDELTTTAFDVSGLDIFRILIPESTEDADKTGTTKS